MTEVLSIDLNHKHLLGTVYLSNPPTSTDDVNNWLQELVAKINMNVLMGPYSIDCITEGNEGITGVVVIETSHASVHFWSKIDEPFVKFDVYSCMDFEVQTVLDHFSTFSPHRIEYIVIDRNAMHDPLGWSSYIL